MVVMLNQFCCGCSLRSGTIIIGIIETIGGIVNVFLNIIAAIEASEDLKNKKNVFDALDTITITNVILAIITTFFTTLAVLLIVGAKRNYPPYLVPWMLYTCFYIFAIVVTYVINTVAYAEANDPLLAGVSVMGAILTLSIQTYYVLVVYSLYRELRGETLLNL